MPLLHHPQHSCLHLCHWPHRSHWCPLHRKNCSISWTAQLISFCHPGIDRVDAPHFVFSGGQSFLCSFKHSSKILAVITPISWSEWHPWTQVNKTLPTGFNSPFCFVQILMICTDGSKLFVDELPEVGPREVCKMDLLFGAWSEFVTEWNRKVLTIHAIRPHISFVTSMPWGAISFTTV